MAINALARASEDVSRLREALDVARRAVSDETDPAAACLALEELRLVRRKVESALREVQELADVAVDALIDEQALGGEPVTGIIPRVKLAADV
jgi:hypothetical protein